ncbi:MAG: HDOD domain-containing protein [Treponema sp.]|nr:HDOD domain-containing protein [Treponema sp.]
MVSKRQITVDSEKIRKATRMGVPLSITTYTLPHEIELYITEILSLFLQELNQERLKDYLSYCINELTANAKKANTKRVYFAERKLDINNMHDYETGMRDFKKDTLSDIDYFLRLQREAGLYVKVIMQVKNNTIVLEIRNNSEMNKVEFKRVFDKIARSRQFATLEEAFSQVMDDSEGAGLGLVILILMLKKVGLNDDHYEVLVENGETITRITMPIDTLTQQHISELTREVVSYIDALPQFPENIARIQKLLNDPDSKLSDIAAHISNDVSLTTDLLKLVNSAAFSLAKKCTSITEAVKLVGIRGIKNLLYSIGSMNILGPSTDEQKHLWAHSYKSGFFAYNLSRNFLKNRVVTEDAYVCGLLHDLGKIVLSALYPELLEKLESVKKTRNIPDQVFNTLLTGINHAEIGAALAEKWNFPPALVAAIRFHHLVDQSPLEYRDLTATVNLADLMIHYQEEDIEFYQIDPEMLRRFNIESETHLQKICTGFQRAFDAERSR